MSKVCENMNDFAAEIASDNNGDIFISKEVMENLDDLFEKCRKYWCDDEEKIFFLRSTESIDAMMRRRKEND